MNRVIPCFAYSCCSICMMLLNKTISSEGARIPLSCVMLVQNLATLILIHVFDACLSDATKGMWKMRMPPFQLKTALLWLPVNIIFLLMLFSGFKSLQLVTVSLVSVCKNVTNVFTTMGDRLLFEEPVSQPIIFALFLMVLAAYLGASDELSDSKGNFEFWAALWISINCLSTSAYGLQIKMSQRQTKLKPYGCTYYNALVATPLTFFWTILSGDMSECIVNIPDMDQKFFISVILSSIIGFGIGFSVFWCISATSPTTYAMVGAANKIPLSLLGILLFGEPVTKERVSFISIGLAAGIIYARAKALLKDEKEKIDGPGSKDQNGFTGTPNAKSGSGQLEDVAMSILAKPTGTRVENSERSADGELRAA